MEFRTKFPNKEELNSISNKEFPKELPVLALVGILCPPCHEKEYSWICEHWTVAKFFWTGEKYIIGFAGGRNEHGLKYMPIVWTPLPNTEDLKLLVKGKEEELEKLFQKHLTS